MRMNTAVMFSLVVLTSIANPLPTVGAISITSVGGVVRNSTDEGLSGLTFAGGTQYYAINDSGALLHPMTIVVDPGSGAISSHSFGSTVALIGIDTEGVAWDPSSAGVWVSDEWGATIKRFSTNGAHQASVTVPNVYASYRSNFSFEALSMRGDSLELWTANEEALYNASAGVDDGSLSTTSAGSVVRLQRFTRLSVHDAWSADGQWAFRTDSISGIPAFGSGSELSGVVDLCVLPDGTVLVLERELGGSFIPGFRSRIYEIDTGAATDVSAIASLSGATYTLVTKTLRWGQDFATDNYEGLCLGPRLNDGSVSLLMISDGDGGADDSLYALKLSGLSTRTLTVASDYGAPNPSGAPLRYTDGADIVCSVTSPVDDGLTRYTCTGWTLAGNSPAVGTTSTCAITLTNDATLTWNWEAGSLLESNSVPYHESFESYSDGYTMQATNGWVSDIATAATVSTNPSAIAALQSYAAPCGFPIKGEHNKVVMIDGIAANHIAGPVATRTWYDQMVQVFPGQYDPSIAAEGHAGIYWNTVNHPVIWNRDLPAGTNRWAEISDVTVAEGDWARITLELSYDTTDEVWGARYYRVWIDGTGISSSHAYTSSDGSGSAGGTWFPMPVGAAPTHISSSLLVANGAPSDDIVVTTSNPLSPRGTSIAIH
jgi:hypothetical protein